MDPKGSIPTAMVNKMSGKQHDEWVKLKKALSA
jgi:hypothetical protein